MEIILAEQMSANLLFEIPINNSETDDDSDSDEDAFLAISIIIKRKLHIPQRIEKYVEEIIPNFTGQQFQQHFRITISAYEHLVRLIGPELHQNNFGRPKIDVDKQLLAIIWLLATPDSYRSVGERFDLAKSSLSECFARVVNLLSQRAPQIIKWPQLEELDGIKGKFQRMAGLNNVIGVVDGTYIPIKAPKEDPECYITRKCNFAFTLQGICDANLKFIDVFIGYPGSVSDIRIFRNSHIYSAVNNNWNLYFPENEFILGDKAYPVLNWCLPPYINRGGLTPAEENFNRVHAKTRQVIERSFALLFGRFRRLKYIDMNRTDWIPSTVVAACVLHNICLDYNDALVEEYIEDGRNFVLNDEEMENIPQRRIQDGHNKRNQICRELFLMRL